MYVSLPIHILKYILKTISNMSGKVFKQTRTHPKTDDDISGQLQSLLDDLLCSKSTPKKNSNNPTAHTNKTLPTKANRRKKRVVVTKTDNEHREKHSFSKSKTHPAVPPLLRPQQDKLIPSPTKDIPAIFGLLNQGKDECNVVDLPEFILVFSAFRANDTIIVPPSDFQPQYFHDSSTNDLLRIETPPNRTSSHQVKYVSYAVRTANVVQRDRQIQVGKQPGSNFSEASVQCDLMEDEDEEEHTEIDWPNHIIEDHLSNDEESMYECHICGEVMSNSFLSHKHSMIHKGGSLLCFRCGLMFPNNHKLIAHEETMHWENHQKALRCPKLHCKKAFHSKPQLFNHINEHTKKTEQQCSKCKRTYSTPLQLLNHTIRRNCYR